jgi:predicted phosphohydrolase
MRNIGNFFVIAGFCLIVVGLLLNVGLRLRWLGKLPGDILIHKGNFTFYFPLTTSLLLSLILSLLLFLVVRITGKN